MRSFLPKFAACLCVYLLLSQPARLWSQNAHPPAITQPTPTANLTGSPTPPPGMVLSLIAPELTEDVLIQTVLSRNPTIAQMTAAASVAAARYPQVTSLEDPMFGNTIGPASIGSRDVD